MLIFLGTELPLLTALQLVIGPRVAGWLGELNLRSAVAALVSVLLVGGHFRNPKTSEQRSETKR